ncbi:hypothetical protein CMI42_03370 [Candidatus Pacearchaeota archaeon]|nr:hypothetical protein [Candidatus Pacearchaeota archaeon]|tara:strand:+ start:191 stop:712 length:522 start_codon:yes stop_codon:yes gene_type:complete
MWEDHVWNEIKRMKGMMGRMLNSTDFREEEIAIQPRNLRHARCDLRENNDEFLIAAEVPGVNKEDINLEVKNNYLIISAEKKFEKSEINREKLNKDSELISEKDSSCCNDDDCCSDQPGSFERKSYLSGFYRTIALPKTADMNNINAEYKDGILKIIVPKDKEKIQKKFVDIK